MNFKLFCSRLSWLIAAPLALISVSAHQSGKVNARDTHTVSHLQDAFSPGWMLQDTNGDRVVDFITGKVVVPANPSAAENAAAANLAARMAFGSTGLTPPLVVSAAEDDGNGPRTWIAKEAHPTGLQAQAAPLSQTLRVNEGGVFAYH
jgi:hypothetical protein